MALTIVAWLLLIGALTVVAFAALSAWKTYRGARLVLCPENQESVVVNVDVKRAMKLAALTGTAELRLSSCTRWPERAGCGQECLRQIENAPHDCLLTNVIDRWYAPQRCYFCRRRFASMARHDHRPGLISPEHQFVEWSEVSPEKVLDVLTTHLPVCWDCLVAENFRQIHPELITDRPPHRGSTLH